MEIDKRFLSKPKKVAVNNGHELFQNRFSFSLRPIIYAEFWDSLTESNNLVWRSISIPGMNMLVSGHQNSASFSILINV